MSTATYNVRIRRKRCSLEEAVAEDEILLYGEAIIVVGEDGKERLKLGDGIHSFTELPWYEDISRISILDKGQPNGVATLDANGKVPLSQIPVLDQAVTLITEEPQQVGTLTYDGTEQTPEWTGYDESQLIISGTLSATEAGTYTVSFLPANGYAWSNGSTSPLSVQWTIEQATGTLSVEPDFLTFYTTEFPKIIAVTTDIPNEISAVSGSDSVATVSTSDKTVTVTPVAAGETSVDVSIVGGVNYTTPPSISCPVSVITSVDSLSLGAEEFQSFIQQGLGPSLFAVGDRLSIPFSGTLNAIVSHIDPTPVPINLTRTLYPAILGFDHNKSLEGEGLAHYVDVEFCHTQDGTKALAFQPNIGGFQMNTADTNIGGWGESDMRSLTCPAFFSLMNSIWKSAVVIATKYTDNVGGGKDDASYVTFTSDKIWLLAEFEIFGVRRYANSAEQSKQLQYPFYVNGGRASKFNFENVNVVSDWWSRSCSVENTEHFCGVGNNDYVSGDFANAQIEFGCDEAYHVYAFAPAARIA